MKQNFKSGFIAIIGRPNVGKSTLLNNFLGEKISIITPKAQTTRNKIQGIKTTDDYQMVFIDTPGIHQAKTKLGETMNKLAYSILDAIDVVLFMIDATKPLEEADLRILEGLNKVKAPVILVFNKVDLVKDEEELKKNIDSYRSLVVDSKGITISATENFNVQELLDMIIDLLPEGPLYYPEDQITDQMERFIVAEIIREKVLLKLSEEVPHSIAVVVDEFKEEKDLIYIHATIVVERPSQKKIVIGAGGSMIKDIGTLARKDIKRFLNAKIFLELFVKVEENWRNKKSRLKEYGYED
ncbi:MAG: GTPase Era [Bacilli bacterium]|jgi:GTP-binding protein Era